TCHGRLARTGPRNVTGEPPEATACANRPSKQSANEDTRGPRIDWRARVSRMRSTPPNMLPACTCRTRNGLALDGPGMSGGLHPGGNLEVRVRHLRRESPPGKPAH